MSAGTSTQRTPRTQRQRFVPLGFLLCVLCVLGVETTPVLAQLKRPKADVTPLVEHPARAGETARVALKVSLPEGLHTQSNKPRDPLLIPTELTIDAPADITVKEVVFPPSTDLKQVGQDQPLAVFEQTFGIGVQLAVANSVKPGKAVVPFHLRYQACDANLCYAPSTFDGEWPLEIGADKAAAGTPDPLLRPLRSAKGKRRAP